MAASASVTLPVTLATPAQAYEARASFGRTPGTSAVTLEGGKATFGFEFPGNIDRLIDRLVRDGCAPGAVAAIDVPVRNLAGGVVDPTSLIAHLNASPAIANAAFDGKTVSATVAATTAAMRYLYEEIVHAGLMPVDMPTVAGPQEFVL